MNSKTATVSLAIFFFTVNLEAQEVIQHSVKKGETVYQLCKLYNVNAGVIYKYNPEAETVIRIGETLSFPKENEPEKPKIEDGYLIHWVSVGETKYGLSKRFSVSISELEELNPHIFPMLQVGQKLRIPAEILITVKWGETLYGISKRYNMTVDELIAVNPKRLQGVLKSGQLLNVSKNAGTEIDDLKNGIYIVKSKDTKFGLSKKFGITIEELERLNPHIIPTLKIDDEIRFADNVVFSKETEKTNKNLSAESKNSVKKESIPTITSFENYIDYTVQADETLSVLSKKAGLSIEELIAINPQLNKVKTGMIIKMPKEVIHQSDIIKTESKILENKKPESKTVENKKVESSDTLVNPSNYLEATLIKNVEKIVVFITPFNENEFKELRKKSQILDKKVEDQINFLTGSLIAVETAKSQGWNVKTKFIKSQEIETEKDLQNNIKKEANAVILSSDRKEDEALIEKYTDINTPVIVSGAEKEYKNENTFAALPSAESERMIMLQYLKELENSHIVVVQDKEEPNVKEAVSKYFPDANYITASESGKIGTDELVNSLFNQKTNFVILNSNKNGVIISSTNTLLKKLDKYKIQLVILENSKIPDMDRLAANRFKILKMLYPSAQVLSPKAKAFIKENDLNDSQNLNNQILKGYDVTFDTLLRLFQETKFKDLAETTDTEQLTINFYYHKNESGSYSNSEINIMQFDENGITKIK